MVFKRLILAILASGLSWAGIASADVPTATSKGKTYHMLPMRDYSATTGCDLRGFNHELKAALRFLIFADSNLGTRSQDIHYTHRHSRGLFRALYQRDNTAENFGLDACMPPSWIEIGVDLALMHPALNEPEHGAYKHRLNALNTSNISLDAFPVMSRGTYMAKTGCTVIPFQYNKYRIAFEWVTLYSGYDDRAHDRMREFLEALARVNPSTGGYLDQKCLIPAISRIAAEFQLLDDQGRFSAP